MSEQYYTAEQAMEILHKTKSTFYREVKAGIYPHERVKGKMRFPAEAIDFHALMDHHENEGLRFVKSTNADIWAGVQLTKQYYPDEDIVSYQRCLEWLHINGDIFMTVRDGTEVVGDVTIMPLDEEVIMSLAREELREQDIPDEAIKKWMEKQVSAYIPTIAIAPSSNLLVNAERGAFLLKSTIRWAISLHLQYDIKNWYSIGVTPEGRAILEALGFSNFLRNGERKAYRLDSLAEGSKMLKRFMHNLEEHNITL
jgi:hypothetical protein